MGPPGPPGIPGGILSGDSGIIRTIPGPPGPPGLTGEKVSYLGKDVII